MLRETERALEACPVCSLTAQAERQAALMTGSVPPAECEAHRAAVRGGRRSLGLSAENADRATLRVDMRDLLHLGLIPSRGEAGESKP